LSARFELRRATGDPELDLARAHALVAAPRRGAIRWELDLSAYDPRVLSDAADAWQARATQEYTSLALFTQLASQIHVLGLPLDWSGAFARMIGDEVRHTELAARMTELLGGAPAKVDAHDLHLPVHAKSLRAHVRGVIVAAFCIGETLSGRFFRRCLRAATVPVAKDVVRVICDDETFHGRFGWEAAALLMRDDGTRAFRDEKATLASQLPELFAHYRKLCVASRDPSWAFSSPEAPRAPNFGTLTDAGYARQFWEGMRDDVVPGLAAIGLPEAAPAFSSLAGDLPPKRRR
jgi:hypothetical protein